MLQYLCLTESATHINSSCSTKDHLYINCHMPDLFLKVIFQFWRVWNNWYQLYLYSYETIISDCCTFKKEGNGDIHDCVDICKIWQKLAIQNSFGEIRVPMHLKRTCNYRFRGKLCWYASWHKYLLDFSIKLKLLSLGPSNFRLNVWKKTIFI